MRERGRMCVYQHGNDRLLFTISLKICADWVKLRSHASTPLKIRGIHPCLYIYFLLLSLSLARSLIPLAPPLLLLSPSYHLISLFPFLPLPLFNTQVLSALFGEPPMHTCTHLASSRRRAHPCAPCRVAGFLKPASVVRSGQAKSCICTK